MLLAKGIIYLTLSQVAFLICGFGIHVFLGRYLDPAQYGIYGLVMTTLLWFEASIISGISVATGKFAGEADSINRRFLINVVLTTIILSTMLFCISVISLPVVLALFNDSSLKYYLFVAYIDILIYPLYTTLIAIVNGRKLFAIQSGNASLYIVSKFLLVIILVYIGMSVYGALMANVIASLIGLFVIIIVFRAKRLIVKTDIKFDLHNYLKYIAKFTIFAAIMQFFMCIDTWMIKYILSDNQLVGFYSVAVVISRIPYLLFGGLVFALYPSMIQTIKTADIELSRKYIKQALRLILIVSAPMSIIVVYYSPEIIHILFSDKYLTASVPLIILFPGMCMLSLYNLFSVILFAIGNMKFLISASMFILILDVLLNYILINRYGLVGASIATTCICSIGSLILWIYLANYFKIKTNYKSILKVLMALVPICILERCLHIDSLLFTVQIGIEMVIYAILLYVMGEITREDIMRLKGVFSRST